MITLIKHDLSNFLDPRNGDFVIYIKTNPSFYIQGNHDLIKAYDTETTITEEGIPINDEYLVVSTSHFFNYEIIKTHILHPSFNNDTISGGKTILEWFDHLDNAHRMKAISNFYLYGTNDMKCYPSLPSAITAAFQWSKTPEGLLYWERVHVSSIGYKARS